MKQDDILKRYPDIYNTDNSEDEGNPANRLYGLRFYKDQTMVEYLAEFLLVFSSRKSLKEDAGAYEFSFDICVDNNSRTYYYPKDKLSLKLFSFFSNSKLDSKHPVHIREYENILNKIGSKMSNGVDKEEALSIIQNLLNGFVGVSQGRTWTAHSFLPISSQLLSREIMWDQVKANKKLADDDTWNAAKKFMNFDKHSFMARGGEVLFLQVANLKENSSSSDIERMLKSSFYFHIDKNIIDMISAFENNLESLLLHSNESLNKLVKFVENNSKEWAYGGEPKRSPLGWVPDRSRLEALLFIHEGLNITRSKVGSLEKIELLQLLCCLQVLRSFCFQSVALDGAEGDTNGFVGNYVWIPSASDSSMRDIGAIVAQRSYEKINTILFRVLRSKKLPKPMSKSKTVSYAEADKHSINLFKKLGKGLGLIIPRAGKGERFALNQTLLRFFVAALIKPGERIRLDTFYTRLFAHYGIALKDGQITTALQWIGDSNQTSYVEKSHTQWVEEALKQGGFLIELSDSVSMVTNPG